MQDGSDDPLRVRGAHCVGRNLSRQLAPVPSRDVHYDGAACGQMLGAEQFNNFVGGATVNAVVDRLPVLLNNILTSVTLNCSP